MPDPAHDKAASVDFVQLTAREVARGSHDICLLDRASLSSASEARNHLISTCMWARMNLAT
jgi:hypothetical protein